MSATHFMSRAHDGMNMSMSGASWPRWDSWHFSMAGLVTGGVGAGLIIVMRRHLSIRQQWFLVGALAASVLLLCSDVQSLSMTSYRSHMIEHLIVLLVIAPLVASSVSLRVPKPVATLGFLAFTVLIPLYHLTPLGSWVMSHEGGHYVELSSFLIIGVWFWTPVYGIRQVMSERQRVTFTTLALPVVATTGLVLWSSTAASLSVTGMRMAMITIGDIHNGGSIMMLWGTILMLVHVIVITMIAAFRGRAERVPIGLRYVVR